MRHHCRHHRASTLARGPRNASVWLSLLAGVSVLAMMTAEPARAQDQTQAQGQFAVDVSDPNVSIDLSVLDDGGLAPQMGAPLPAAASPSASADGYRAPGPKAPVSTLYIQPSGTFTLPPQTKTLIAEPTPEATPSDAETEVVEQAPAAPEPATQEEPAPEVVAAPPAPAAPEVAAPGSAAEQTAKVEPQPAAAEQATPQAAPEPTPEATPEATPEPAPEPAVVKAEPAPAPTPAPVPVQEPEKTTAPKTVAPKTVAQDEATPPPPPQALTTPAPAPQPQPESKTAAEQPAPDAKAGAVVVDLPPKLEEAQPGVASLPSATGPLADGDSMRIVFEHDSSKLPGDARDALKALSDRMGQQDTLRLQLLAYAGDADTSASAARRLSLSRALAVRSYLIENGVRSTRIDVRALGNKSTEEVTERVDITVVER